MINMQLGQQHSIKKLLMEFDVNSQRMEPSDLNGLSSYSETHLLPVLEQKFDKYCSDSATITIDRLELEMDIILDGSWEDELLDAFELALEKKLWSLDINSKNVDDRFGSTSIAALFHYLQFGSLPWYYTAVDFKSFELECTEQITGSVADELIDLFIAQPVGFKRMFHAFSDDFFKNIASHRFGSLDGIPGYRKLRTAFSEVLGIPLSQKIFRQYYTEALVITLEKSITRTDQFTKNLVEILLERNFKIDIKAHEDKSANHQTSSNEPKIGLKESLDLLSDSIINFLATGLKNNSAMPLALDISEAIMNDAAGKKPPRQGSDYKARAEIRPRVDPNVQDELSWRENEASEIEQQLSLEDGIYIPYAGIVLLHPFLKPLFENLGLIMNGKWVSIEHTKRAIHLLAYLATGRLSCPEYDMTLFKLLCGLPTDHFIETQLKLTHTEKTEGDNILTALLKHWNALKTNSHEALRSAFIHRKGKLSLQDEDWEIRVEQKSQDVLLNTLPWGLGVVKFPWLSQLIRIIWT